LMEMGQMPVTICDALIELFRDLMVLKAAGADSGILILTEAEKKTLAGLGDLFDLPGLIYAVTALERLRWMIRNSESARYLLEAALLRLALSEHFIGLDQLVSANSSSADIKKNVPLPNPPAVSPPPTVSQSPSAPAEISNGPLTEEILKSRWKEFLAALAQRNGMLANYLTQGTVAGFADSVLILRFSSSVLFAAEFCRKRQEEIQRALQEFFGSRLTVRVELSGEPAARPVPKPAPAAAPATRQQRIEALDDPKVQMILKELNATPTEIVELPPSEEESEQEPREESPEETGPESTESEE
ncbi:MAG TPA: hypothetical protein PKY88_13315, partial [Anaerohalosphaeraceae bacterium]|nr:hypothetical protein [Anaerohalosphaeraceae bacterium]